MSNQNRHKRQTGIYNPAEHEDMHVTIVGVGNIGSHTAIALSKMGIKHITLYDNDTVEEHNTASQAYTMSDIGKPKVEVLKAHILEHAPECEVTAIQELYDGTSDTEGILVSAVDSIHTRKEIAENIRNKPIHVVDGRMGGGQIEVHSMRAREWLRSIPEQADTDPCSARYISYTSYIIAGVIANTIKRLIMGEKDIKRYILHTNTYDSIVERYV